MVKRITQTFLLLFICLILATDVIAATATLDALNEEIIVGVQGQSSVGVQITGTLTDMTLTFQATKDGSTWVAVEMFPAGSSTAVTTTTATGLWHSSVAGFDRFRVTVTAYISGTATVTIDATSGVATKGGGSVSGTVDVNNFPDNEPFNLAQVGGSAPSVTNPLPVRFSDGAVFPDPIVACDSSAFINMTTATTTQIVVLSAGTSIYVCSFSIVTSDASNVKFVEGTGANCVTGQSDLTSNMPFQTGGTGIARGSGLGSLFSNTASEALCVTSSAAVTVGVDVSYTQF